jgi:hypothetical protein
MNNGLCNFTQFNVSSPTDFDAASSLSAGVFGQVSIVDVDRDGYVDIWLPTGDGTDTQGWKFFLWLKNNGDGSTFIPQDTLPGIATGCEAATSCSTWTTQTGSIVADVNNE